VAWAFTLALVADAGMDFWPAMALSRKVVSKHWWKFLWFFIVLGGLELAGYLACIVGIFIATPIVWAAIAYAYEDIFAPAAAAASSAAAPAAVRSRSGARTIAGLALGAAAAVLLIAFIGLLAAIAIPNFVKARQQAQHNAAQQWTQEGWQLWQAGKLAEAEGKFQQAVQLAPGDANAWNGLGWAQFNAGNSAAAGTSFQKAIAISTNVPGALNGLGQIYLSQRKYDEAERSLLQAAPKAPAAWFGLARLYLLEGKFADAEKYAQRIVDSGQADETARKMLASAKARNLSDGLRFMIEPPPAKNSSQAAPVEIMASQMTFDNQSQTLTASGGPVVIIYGRTNDSANFGPVIERVVEEPTAPDWNCFDLDKGKAVSLRELGTNDDWETGLAVAQKHGADLRRIESGLMGLDLVSVPVDSQFWANPAPMVIEMVAPAKVDFRISSLRVSTNSQTPATFVFKTAEGGMGILQIISSTNNPPGVKIRYKLVQSGGTSTGEEPTLAEQPPVIVETFPISGARDVLPGETEIRVRFSKPMVDKSWSWSSVWEKSEPEYIGEPHYLDDHRTCVVKVRLEPGKTYAWWLNSQKFGNFKDQAGQPAVPYLLIFQTKQN